MFPPARQQVQWTVVEIHHNAATVQHVERTRSGVPRAQGFLETARRAWNGPPAKGKWQYQVRLHYTDEYQASRNTNKPTQLPVSTSVALEYIDGGLSEQAFLGDFLRYAERLKGESVALLVEESVIDEKQSGTPPKKRRRRLHFQK